MPTNGAALRYDCPPDCVMQSLDRTGPGARPRHYDDQPRIASRPAGCPIAGIPTTGAVGVMPREGHGSNAGKDAIRSFDIEPCYVYHPLNAYSEMRDGAEVLVLDVVRYSRMFDRDLRGPGDSRPTLDRWTINLATGAVTSERRDDRPQEFPRINEGLLGGRHRFGYTIGTDGGYLANGVRDVHRALQARLRDRIRYGRRPGCRPATRRDVLCAQPRGLRRRRRHPDGLRLSPTATKASWFCWTRRRSSRWPPSTCPSGCRWASTATGRQLANRCVK